MPRVRVALLLFAFVGVACGRGSASTETDGGTSGATVEMSTTSPSTGGSGGSASGTSGSTGGGGALRCEPQCGGDADCLYMGGDIGFRCIDSVCVFPACMGDEACVAELSGWAVVCTGPGDCAAAQACVDIGGGAGRCANNADAFACTDFGLAAISRPTLGGGSAMVCGNPDAICSEGECVDPCKTDEECAPVMGHPKCEVGSGACVCASDLDCLTSQVPGFVTCIEGRCGCRKDIDCEGGSNVDTCYAGVCGCSSDATCTAKIFDGAVLTCK